MLLSFLKSKTVIGALIALICTALQGAGIEMSTDNLQNALDKLLEVGQLLGPALAIVGRAVAKGPLVGKTE